MRHTKTENNIYFEENELDDNLSEDYAVEDKENEHKNYHKVIAIMIVIIMMVYLFSKYRPIDKPFSFTIIYTIVSICICVFLFLGINKILEGKYKLEKVFITCAIPLGLIYTLLIPPGIVPDEWVHMQNTFSLSSQIIGKEENNKITMKNSELELYNQQITVGNNDYYNYIYNNIFSISKDNNYSNIDVESPGLGQLFGYFPAVLGTTVSRVLHLGAVTTVYVARLCNFIFYLALTFFALKKIPFGKVLLFAITMLPMASHQMFSLSYDTIINSASFFCIAYGMFFVYQSSKVELKDVIAYGLSGILLLANKGSAYAFILVIPILAKYFNPNEEPYARKIKKMTFLIIILGIMLIKLKTYFDAEKVASLSTISGQKIVSWAGVPSYTLSEMLSNIPGTIQLFLDTFVQKGNYYINTAIGSLMGWLLIPIPTWIINSWIGILIVSAFVEKSDRDVFTYRHKLLYFLIALGVILVVMLAMALDWTPSGYTVIEGVQGRYYIPIIFLLLIPLQNSKLYLKQKLISFLLVIIPIMSAITVINLIPLVL